MERTLYLSELETEDSVRHERETLFFEREIEHTFVVDDFYSVIDWKEEEALNKYLNWKEEEELYVFLHEEI